MVQTSATFPILLFLWVPTDDRLFAMARALGDAVNKLNGQIQLSRIDIASNPSIAQAFQIQGAPALFALIGGRPMPILQGLPSDEELQQRISDAKQRLGSKLLILGHFYQRDEIIKHADFVGDSFQLAKNATERPDADHIVFCGVHFMAETADILSTPEQSVTLPNLSAGCSMADMANIDQVQECWDQLGEICGTQPDSDGLQQIIPVTYMNSSAALKAFCGRNGGIVCTSSNAHAVLEWAFARGKRVLFFPDQHLAAIPPARWAFR